MNARRLLLLALMITTSSAHVGSTAIEAGAASGTLVVTIQGFRSAASHVESRPRDLSDPEAARAWWQELTNEGVSVNTLVKNAGT